MAKRRSGGFNSTRGTTFGKLERIFDDIWWAWGTVRFAPGIVFPRNMTIVREADGGLVVIHPVLMPDETMKELDALGPVKHVVRLGAFHGMDDPNYLARYPSATAWVPEEVDLREGARADKTIVAGGESPIAGATNFSFDASKSSELAVVVPRHGGVLITCDSVQNWERPIAGLSTLGSGMSSLMGFKGRACVGAAWKKQCEPKDGVGFRKDFERLVALEWKHLFTAHGRPIRETARDDLRGHLARLYK